MSMKNSNDTIGNRTRDLPTCRAVPQPTAPPRAPSCLTYIGIYRPSVLNYPLNTVLLLSTNHIRIVRSVRLCQSMLLFREVATWRMTVLHIDNIKWSRGHLVPNIDGEYGRRSALPRERSFLEEIYMGMIC